MRYKIVITKKPEKQLKKIDSRYKPKIITALVDLSKDPYIGKKLEGELRGEWSYRVGKYRILYLINNDELVVLIIKVAPRGGAY